MNTEFDFLCDTILHVTEVQENLEIISSKLRQRGFAHDRTKFKEFENVWKSRISALIALFQQGRNLKRQIVELTKPAIEHHYKNNRHHTGYHENGINDMNLIDIIEMIADWKAAERRSPDKKLIDTLEYAYKKYEIDFQLQKIITQTLLDLGWI